MGCPPHELRNRCKLNHPVICILDFRYKMGDDRRHNSMLYRMEWGRNGLERGRGRGEDSKGGGGGGDSKGGGVEGGGKTVGEGGRRKTVGIGSGLGLERVLHHCSDFLASSWFGGRGVSILYRGARAVSMLEFKN